MSDAIPPVALADLADIKWTRPLLTRFRAAYQAARAVQAETFTFEGHAFVVGYAKYLIEYLDARLVK